MDNVLSNGYPEVYGNISSESAETSFEESKGEAKLDLHQTLVLHIIIIIIFICNIGIGRYLQYRWHIAIGKS